MPVGQLLPLTWSTRRHKYAHLEFYLLVILLIFMYMEFVYIQFCFLFSLQYTVLCCIIILIDLCYHDIVLCRTPSSLNTRVGQVHFFYNGTFRDCRQITTNKCGHWYMVFMTVCARAISVLHEHTHTHMHTGGGKLQRLYCAGPHTHGII